MTGESDIPMRSRLSLITACVLFTAACGSVSAQNDATTAIPPALMASAEAWNKADLPGHIGLYTENATFMGGSGPIQGRDVVGESLAKSFWRDGKPKQTLSFDRIEVRPLGDSARAIDRALRSDGRR